MANYYRPCGLGSCLLEATMLLPNSEGFSLEKARCLSGSWTTQSSKTIPDHATVKKNINAQKQSIGEDHYRRSPLEAGLLKATRIFCTLQSEPLHYKHLSRRSIKRANREQKNIPA